MGILLVAAFGIGDAHIGQQLQGAVFGLSLGDLVVQGKGLFDLLANGLQGVQGGHGILKHHGDALAADLDPLFFLFELGQIHAAVFNGAVIDPAVVVQQTHEVFTENGLAGAGLTHDGQAFALVQVHTDAADGRQHLAAQVELDHKVFDAQNNFSILVHTLPPVICGCAGRMRQQRRCPAHRTRR